MYHKILDLGTIGPVMGVPLCLDLTLVDVGSPRLRLCADALRNLQVFMGLNWTGPAKQFSTITNHPIFGHVVS